MLQFISLTVKNFLSVGNVSQSIRLDHGDLVLVLGENLDMGGNDYRNGVGKTTIINALSYAIYGKTISDIKISNLINKTNKKNMSVCVTFKNNNNTYFIERSRKPDKLIFTINGDSSIDATDNEANGENRITQEAIERAIGINHLMFKHIVALNTYTDPFLKMSGPDQRQVIEQLLGITALSEKAEILSKHHIKETKNTIREQELMISAVLSANRQIENSINSIQLKGAAWAKNHKQKLDDLTAAATSLLSLDIEREIETHRKKQDTRESNRLFDEATKIKNSIADEYKRCDYQTKIRKIKSSIENLNTTSECPVCQQTMHDDKCGSVMESYTAQLDGLLLADKEINDRMLAAQSDLDKLPPRDNTQYETFYNTLEDALSHKTKIDAIGNTIESTMAECNPYDDQIDSLKEGIVAPDYDNIEKYKILLEHQEFLYKLLMNKDSFIRKKIINQNLSFLNSRLEFYLRSINLPHSVTFMSDLSVEISELGRDLDFDNLSRGERTRLTLSLALAFRDMYESLNGKIDLLFVDELIDTGLDPNGVESCLTVLKQQNRTQNKSVFLISHRDELVGRVSNILKVIKDGGFTMFEHIGEENIT